MTPVTQDPPAPAADSSILTVIRGALDRASTLTVRKRDGRSAEFDEACISGAIERAFRSTHGLSAEDGLPHDLGLAVRTVTRAVLVQVLQEAESGRAVEVETIQDAVERELMRAGHFAVAKHFILYRSDRKKARVLTQDTGLPIEEKMALSVIRKDGTREALKPEKIRMKLERACAGLACDPVELGEEVMATLYDGVAAGEIAKAMIFAARSRIEREPGYAYASARLLLNVVYGEAFGRLPAPQDLAAAHREGFRGYVEHGIRIGRLSERLCEFDLDVVAGFLDIERDHAFQYLGLQTLYDRYLLHDGGRRFETPQYFWMRVAMGLALNEGRDKERRAAEFYEVLSRMLFVSSTPTLFNAGTPHAQLSSCYLLTVQDDLESIFKLIADDARLSKWAGGLGNDWTNVRATGGHIKGTNGTSQGIVPFLKVANDTAVAVNQGGKRKGAMCAYLESWHLDIEEFLDLRKNTGDERRRTHDMNTANWIPDLFMKRVKENGQWSLFDPSEVPDLHDLYGRAFEERYAHYEAMADAGALKLHKRMPAADLWKKMLSRLFETGHPWITFKDPSNIRSPQDHAGVVHSSNLCTEILLNSSAEETAVCNLGSINLPAHVRDGALDRPLLERTIRTAMRMLDNVIDINYYPTPETRTANRRHRPVGLGIMGYQDALYALGIDVASDAAVEFADASMETISYHAIDASIALAEERGTYESYPGSKWDRGFLPIDTIDLLAAERQGDVEMDRTTRLDWTALRARLSAHGMRNSNTLAIAPTATIANIAGVSQSIEPTYKHLYSKSNMSGDFVSVNTFLVDDLKARGLWDADMLDDLKYFDGVLAEIERIPADLREKYRTAFEIDPRWLIEAASRRQKWIDMGQSLNLYMAEPSGQKISEMYLLAWERGLKTTYYLRTLSATQVEKSTQDINKRGLQPRWMKNASASANVVVARSEPAAPKACAIDNPGCEACQ